jgi:hypothetical protein
MAFRRGWAVKSWRGSHFRADQLQLSALTRIDFSVPRWRDKKVASPEFV